MNASRSLWALLVLALSLAPAPARASDEAFGGARLEEPPDAGHTPVLTKPPALLARRRARLPRGGQGPEAHRRRDHAGRHRRGRTRRPMCRSSRARATASTRPPSPRSAVRLLARGDRQRPRRCASSTPSTSSTPSRRTRGRRRRRGGERRRRRSAGTAEGPRARARRAQAAHGAGVRAAVGKEAGEPAISEAGATSSCGCRPAPTPRGARPGARALPDEETIKPGEQLEVTYYVMPKAFGLYETVVRGSARRRRSPATRCSARSWRRCPARSAIRCACCRTCRAWRARRSASAC